MTSTPPRRPWLAVAILGVVVIAAAAIAVAVGRMLLVPSSEVVLPAGRSESTELPPSSAPDVIYVHVSGAVTDPGVFALPDGSRVVDAVTAAQGFTADADPTGVNLARYATDGEQIHVPVIGEAVPPDAATGSGLINLNTATAAELEELPGIGPALAGRIVTWREEHGPFSAVDDLLSVPGIGPKVLHSLSTLVTL